MIQQLYHFTLAQQLKHYLFTLAQQLKHYLFTLAQQLKPTTSSLDLNNSNFASCIADTTTATNFNKTSRRHKAILVLLMLVYLTYFSVAVWLATSVCMLGLLQYALQRLENVAFLSV